MFQAAKESLRQTTPRAWRVLIVDDEEPVRRFVQRVLSEAGYDTATAGSGAEAQEMAQKQAPPDLLLTDVNMPQMLGDELARRLRQIEPSLKVLYLTGFSDQLFKEKVTLWEDEAYLDKPCSVKGLLEAVSLLMFGKLAAPPLGSSSIT
jgi:two-component system cell cycle sensor histidine kinase/response regulator CckA